MKQKVYYIYLYQNKINNKIYIGKTCNLAKRATHHKLVAKYGKEKYKNSYSYFQKAINKYGIDNFSYDVIEQFDVEQEALEAEKFWIQYFRSWEHTMGYNITMGGDGVSGFKHSKETKEHLSEIMIGRKRTLQSIELMVSQTKGELSSNSKITEIQAKEIIEKWATGNYTCKKLGIEYNLSPQQIHKIATGKRWKHLIG